MGGALTVTSATAMANLLDRRRRAAEKLAGRPISPAEIKRVREHERHRRQTFLIAFLLFGAVAHLGYGTFFVLLDDATYLPLLVVAGVEAAALVAFVGAVRSHEVAAGVASQVLPIPAVLVYISAFSADAAIGGLLLLGVVGVFVFIPETRPLFRIEVGVAIGAAILFSELYFTRERAWAPISDEATHTFATTNRIALAAGLFVLAIIVHRRALVQLRIVEGAQLYAERLADTDQLTGLANRRPLVAEMRRLARDRDASVVIAIADIDQFKKFNDDHGHGCGDAALRHVASRLREGVRGNDLVGRWGGEEFMFILHGIDEASAAKALDRVRAAVADSRFECTPEFHEVTISIGVAGADADAGLQERLRRADAAVYAAKAAGRNRVVSFASLDESSAAHGPGTGTLRAVSEDG